MNDEHDAAAASRRRFLKLAALFTVAGALPLRQAFERAVAAEPNAPVRVGYLPITDATPLLIAHHNGFWKKQGLEVDRPTMFRGWAQIVEAFLAGRVNVVHMLSPMTVYARYGSKSRTKVVAWNHVDGSGLLVAVRKGVHDAGQLGGSTIAIPFWYSIHNIILQLLLRRHGLRAIKRGTPTARQVKLVVMAPSDMLPALAAGRVAGYIVADPFIALGEIHRIGDVLRFTGDVWKNHACCVVEMHEHDIDSRPEWTRKIVNGIVAAEAWTRSHRGETARILSRKGSGHYMPWSERSLAKVLDPPASELAHYQASGAMRHYRDWHEQRIDFQPYPYPSYTVKMVELLKHTVVEGASGFLAELDPDFVARDLVDERFVRKAIADAGGMGVFGLPDGYTRTEVIAP